MKPLLSSRTLATLATTAIAVAMSGAPLVANAHDTWVMPDNFLPPAGLPVSATMSAGDGLKAESAPKRERIVSLELVDADGRRAHTGWKSQKTMTQLTFPALAQGVSCLAVTTREREIQIKPALVDAYLAEIQPKPDILASWARQRARGEVWKERYAKDGKTCLRAGDSDAGWPQLATLGQQLEIVPQQNPTRLRKGDRLDVVLIYRGQPLQDTALRLFSGSEEQVVRTDAQGRAGFALARGGRHLIATTVLNLPEGPGAPWTSRFATLGFGVPE